MRQTSALPPSARGNNVYSPERPRPVQPLREELAHLRAQAVLVHLDAGVCGDDVRGGVEVAVLAPNRSVGRAVEPSRQLGGGLKALGDLLAKLIDPGTPSASTMTLHVWPAMRGDSRSRIARSSGLRAIVLASILDSSLAGERRPEDSVSRTPARSRRAAAPRGRSLGES